MLNNITCIADDNFVFQQDNALVHLAFNTVQLLQYKTLKFFSHKLRPCNSVQLNSTDYKIYGVIQQKEHELRVTRLNKLN